MSKQRTAATRPRQRVLEFLHKEYLEGGRTDHRLPTIEELAVLIGVSQSTIRNAIRELSDQGYLKTIQGRGTFVAKAEPVARRPLVLASNIVSTRSNLTLNWSATIYYGAINAAAQMPEGITIHPVIAKPNQKEVVPTLMERMKFIDLLLLYGLRWPTIEMLDKLAIAYEREGKPVVWINPPTISSVKNFVSSDYFGAAWRVGKAWRLSGRRRVLYIPSFSVAASAANQLLLQGLTNGLMHYDQGGGELRVELVQRLSPDTGREMMEQVLADGYRPDAILCESDFVGKGVVDYLREKSFGVPDEVSVVAGTGLHSTQEDHPGLSMLLQPMEEIGAAAVQMLYDRYRNGNRNYPGIYLPTAVYKGETTRAEENRLLEKYEKQPYLFLE
ncbi:MAG TPA: LacI family DNA-binding transcriptional regulator [Chthoniobacteraceae bacterium]|nr:LacI family DNA-binding transcriptional regulator [Chthoniobacteraceae bacterium]